MSNRVAIDEKTGEYSPYLAGRLEWDARHGSAFSRERIWRILAIIALLGLVLEGGALVVMASNARSIKPYVAIVNGDTGRRLQTSEGDRQSARIKSLCAWIEDTRLVTADNELQRRASNRALSQLSRNSQALEFVMRWWRTETQAKREARSLVYAEVDPNPLQIGDNTYEVTWTENEYTAQGQMSSQHWKAALTIGIHEPSSKEELDANAGVGDVFITHVSWAKVGEREEVKK